MITDHARRTLPIADMAAVVRHTRELMLEHRSYLGKVLLLHALAAAAALAGPWLVGRLVDTVGTEAGRGEADRLAIALAGAVVVQTALTWTARRASLVLGETVFAQLREQFVGRAVNLPLSTVERAGTGDLVSRTTNDVEALSHVVRFGIPSIFVASVTVVMTVVATLVTSPMAALPMLLGVPLYWLSTRRYLRYAGNGYLWERATYAALNGVVAETVDGARTIDALSIAGVRRSRFHRALRECYAAERYTLGLRLRWFPIVEFGYFVPIAGAILWGGLAGDERPRHGRGCERCRAVHPPDGRAARRGADVARRTPGRRDLAGPGDRRRRGAARPGGHRRQAGRRAAGGAPGALLVPARP